MALQQYVRPTLHGARQWTQCPFVWTRWSVGTMIGLFVTTAAGLMYVTDSWFNQGPDVRHVLADGFNTDEQLVQEGRNFADVALDRFETKQDITLKRGLDRKMLEEFIGRISQRYGLEDDVKADIMDGLKIDTNVKDVKEFAFVRGKEDSNSKGTVLFIRCASSKSGQDSFDFILVSNRLDFELSPSSKLVWGQKYLLGFIPWGETLFRKVEHPSLDLKAHDALFEYIKDQARKEANKHLPTPTLI